MIMKRITLIVVALFLVIQSYSQESQIVNISEASEFKIEGTSTLHDWHSISSEIKGGGNVIIENNSLKNINDFQLKLAAESIKSGKGKMDNETYKALKTDDYPDISFVSRSTSISGNNMKVKGDLKIAGATKSIELDVSFQLLTNGIKFTGSKKINMKDWGVNPPELFMGTLKTGEEVTIIFNITCNK